MGIKARVMIAWAVLAGVLCAQSGGVVRGTVTDASKAPFSAVPVVLTNLETGTTQKGETDTEGRYQIQGVNPGNYRVSAEAPGFKAVSRDLILPAGSAIQADLVLTLADSKQIIEVTDAVSTLQTEDSQLSSTVSAQELLSVPLGSRNVMEIAMTIPGVGGDVGSDENGVFQDVPTNGSGLSIGGGRAGSSAFLSDGGSSTSVGIGRATVSFSPDTVQEVQIITSSFSAKYGTTGGGIINTVSRSGGNRHQATAYWYHRNPFFGARQFNRPIPNQQRRNEVGLILSGPVTIPKIYNGRKKTFYLLTIEPKRYSDQVEIYDRFPTAEERQGNFTNMWVPPGQRRPLLYQQFTCWPSFANCQQLNPLHRPSASAEYPLFNSGDPDPARRGRIIPRQFLDPLVQKILQDVPMPNMPFDPQGRNYFGVRGVNGASNRWSLKLDHNITQNQRASFRYTEVPSLDDRYRVDRTSLFNTFASDRGVSKQAFLQHTWTLTPRVVNELRLNYQFGDYSRSLPGDLGTRNYNSELFGLPSGVEYGYPRFNSGFGNYGYVGSAVGDFREHQYQIMDDLSTVRGKHTLSMGVDLRLMMLNSRATSLTAACCPTYAWAAGQTNSGNANTPGGTGGNQFAAFLLGVPNAVTLQNVVIPYYYRYKVAAGYFQDDWKIKSNLTLNLGLRWQYNSPRYEKYDRQAQIDLDNAVELRRPDGSLQGITFNYMFAGKSGRSRYLEPPFKKNFEPRVGFAYVPKWKWLPRRPIVVRGGYGISHPPRFGRGRDPLPAFGTGASGNWAFSRWASNGNPPRTQTAVPTAHVRIGTNPPVMTPVNPLVFDIPSSGVLCHACAPRDIRVPTGNLFAFSTDAASPYIQTWNLTIQAELGNSWMFQTSYLGQKGNHLYGPLLNINPPDREGYEELLEEGIDPNEQVEDPFGRTDAAGNLIFTTRANLLRPVPTAGDINLAGLTNAKSIYHAGTASIEKRYSRHWVKILRVNYTWGKTIDTSSDGALGGPNLFLWGNTTVQNPWDINANRSVSNFDTRHRVNAVVTMDVPLGRRHVLLAQAPKRVLDVVSAWQTSLIFTRFSGFPFAPYLNDANGVPSGASGAERIRPDVVPGVPVVNPRWSKNVANDVPYFNPEAFARPQFGRLGDTPRTLDYARTPWRQTANLSLWRDFRPFKNERRTVQLRADAFNVLNKVTFSTSPGATESPGLFATAPPVTRTGTDLSGPMPYLVGLGANSFPNGTREAILAQNYNQNFGKLWRDRNGPGRSIQFALRINF